jgi:hypothetical protein
MSRIRARRRAINSGNFQTLISAFSPTFGVVASGAIPAGFLR